MSDRRKRRSLSSGDRIGKYQLDKIIHQGKYRTIYKAHDPFLERDVAIKVSQFPDDADISILGKQSACMISIHLI